MLHSPSTQLTPSTKTESKPKKIPQTGNSMLKAAEFQRKYVILKHFLKERFKRAALNCTSKRQHSTELLLSSRHL